MQATSSKLLTCFAVATNIVDLFGVTISKPNHVSPQKNQCIGQQLGMKLVMLKPTFA